MQNNLVCPICHSEMKSNYCSKCGILINRAGEVVSLLEKNLDDSLELFVGANYYKFVKKGNYAAGFFGPLYLIYRKCYLFGFILTSFELYITILLKNVDLRVLLFLKFLSFLFYYSYGNAIYLHIAKKKIKKMDLRNKKILQKKGDTSIIALFLSLLLFEIMIILYFKWI